MNVIYSKSLARDAGRKPVSTFPHPALGKRPSRSAADLRHFAAWVSYIYRFGRSANMAIARPITSVGFRTVANMQPILKFGRLMILLRPASK
jgi:hypothetical protein